MTSNLKINQSAATAGNINKVFSGNSMAETKRFLRDTINIIGTETTNATVDLPPLGRKGIRLVPEEFRIRFGGSGTLNVIGKWQRVTSAGVATDITGTQTLNASAVVTFAAAVATEQTELADGEFLRLILTTVTTVTAGRTLLVECGYTERSGPALNTAV